MTYQDAMKKIHLKEMELRKEREKYSKFFEGQKVFLIPRLRKDEHGNDLNEFWVSKHIQVNCPVMYLTADDASKFNKIQSEEIIVKAKIREKV